MDFRAAAAAMAAAAGVPGSGSAVYPAATPTAAQQQPYYPATAAPADQLSSMLMYAAAAQAAAASNPAYSAAAAAAMMGHPAAVGTATAAASTPLTGQFLESLKTFNQFTTGFASANFKLNGTCCHSRCTLNTILNQSNHHVPNLSETFCVELSNVEATIFAVLRERRINADECNISMYHCEGYFLLWSVICHLLKSLRDWCNIFL